MKKLSWGIIGGGEGSQIGEAHRICSAFDNLFSFKAASMDINAEKGRKFAKSLGVEDDRAYGSWQEMLEGEKKRDDRIDLVTIATPNSTHYEIAKSYLENGFNVLVEKPMTMTVEDARDLVNITNKAGLICAVNYGYSGYSLVREMREIVKSGEIGQVRSFLAEFSHGFHGDAKDIDNPRIRWRYDPKQAGVSSQFADCGIHALHLASYIIGSQPKSLSADFASCVSGRELEDDALVALRMENGTVGRLWTSSIAIGKMHGLKIQIFGEEGGLAWEQESPNKLYYNKLGKTMEVVERAQDGLSEASMRSTRLTIGHMEGFFVAMANIYKDIYENIIAKKEDRSPDSLALSYPTVIDGYYSMAAIHAAAKSAKNGSRWQNLDEL